MPRERRYCVYLLTNKNDLSVGVTNNLERRVHEHKEERKIKKWRREKKNNLAVAANPEWTDLSDGWFEISPCGRDDKSGGTCCG